MVKRIVQHATLFAVLALASWITLRSFGWPDIPAMLAGQAPFELKYLFHIVLAAWWVYWLLRLVIDIRDIIEYELD